jgi:hypothetical protein
MNGNCFLLIKIIYYYLLKLTEPHNNNELSLIWLSNSINTLVKEEIIFIIKITSNLTRHLLFTFLLKPRNIKNTYRTD